MLTDLRIYCYDKKKVNDVSAIIKDCSDPSLAWVIERHYAEMIQTFGESIEDGYMIKVVSSIPDSTFNGVWATNLNPANVDDKIRETKRFFDSIGNTHWRWRVTLTSKPSNLGERLEAQGFTRVGEGSPGMAINLSSMKDDFPKPPNFVVKHVEDSETYKTYLDVLFRSFGFPEAIALAGRDVGLKAGIPSFPPRRAYIGYLEGKPVATSYLFLRLGVAGIYCVGTLPEARGKGIGTEMTLAPLREAADIGYKVGILQSTKMGFGVYRRIGFETYCQIVSYKPPV